MFRYFVHGDLFVLVHGTDAPDDAEWDRYLEVFARLDRPNQFARILVLTEGGSPSNAQRERLLKVSMKGDRSAVVSSAAIPRFVVSLITLMNKGIRAFAPSDFARAADFIEMSAEEQKVALEEIERLIREGSIGALRVLEESLACAQA